MRMIGLRLFVASVHAATDPWLFVLSVVSMFVAYVVGSRQ